MSGQPLIFPLDAAKFRKQYLTTLNLQALINEKNYQANKLYKKSGIPTQPTDTRTLTEKLADIERLKIDLNKKLLEITSGDEVQNIIRNLTDTEIQYAASRIDFIINDLKPKYKLGVPAPVFVNYLRALFRKDQQTQGVDFGLQEATGRQIIADTNLIRETMLNRDDLMYIRNMMLRTYTDIRGDNEQMKNFIINSVGILQDAFNEIQRANQEAIRSNNPILRGQIMAQINAIVEDLPTKADLENYKRQVEEAIRVGNADIVLLANERFAQVLQGDGDLQDNIEELKKLTESLIPTTETEFIESLATAPASKPEKVSGKLDEKTVGVLRNYVLSIYKFFNYYFGNETYDIFNSEEYSWGDNPVDVTGTILKKSKIQLVRFLNANKIQINNLLSRDVVIPATAAVAFEAPGGSAAAVATPLKPEQPKRRVLASSGKKASVEEKKTEGSGLKKMKGSGIYKKRYDIIDKSKIDFNKGISPIKKWVPFGKNVINISKLNDNIISVKRVAGSGISGIKAQRVSKNLGGIFKKVVGGGLPSYDDLSKLENDEKEYLYKVIRSSDLLEKLNIPTPSKDEDEKDINSFEIMRGQIVAGNDNKELIKNFKAILIKLMNKKLLPKSQAKDILLELSENEV